MFFQEHEQGICSFTQVQDFTSSSRVGKAQPDTKSPKTEILYRVEPDQDF